MNQIDLRHGDCMEILKTIPDASIDLVLTDPPYGVIATLGDSSVYNYSKDCHWDVALDTTNLFKELSRVLRVNGKCLLFCMEPYTSELITNQLSALPFSYKLIWKKNVPGNVLLAKKACCNYYEEILLFSKRHDVENKHPLRSYFMSELEASGYTTNELNKLVGNYMPSTHYFTGGAEFMLPTETNYKKLQSTGYFKKPYEELKAIDSAYKSAYKSVFNLWEGKKSKSNVLEYPREQGGYHPTQKPVLLLEDLIKTFSNPGDLVLDFTMGSGSTGVACVNTDRRFIGIELNEEFYNTAVNRINEALSKREGF